MTDPTIEEVREQVREIRDRFSECSKGSRLDQVLAAMEAAVAPRSNGPATVFKRTLDRHPACFKATWDDIEHLSTRLECALYDEGYVIRRVGEA